MMAQRLRVEWLGRSAYTVAHQQMVQRLEQRIAGDCGDTLLLCEHEPVYTLGRSRQSTAHLHTPGNTPVVKVERGGDVTFHGPGQLVAYPICQLTGTHQDLHAWLRGLEQVTINVLQRFGIEGVVDPRNSGVWVAGKKIAAVGIACRKWTTWHGVAINLDLDLAPFGQMDPCGMDSALVTRMSDHLQPCPSLRRFRDTFASEFRAWWQTWHESPSVG